MVVSDLLILYCPGSRGDFLAAVLTDTIDQCYQQLTLSPDLRYNKMHGIDEGNNPWDESLNVSSILQHQNRSIRIKLAPSDYKFVAHLVETKRLPSVLDQNDVHDWEQNYCRYDIIFGHVVSFSDLFDIEFLKDFYQRFNNRPIPEQHVPMIEHNIALQVSCKP